MSLPPGSAGKWASWCPTCWMESQGSWWPWLRTMCLYWFSERFMGLEWKGAGWLDMCWVRTICNFTAYFKNLLTKHNVTWNPSSSSFSVTEIVGVEFRRTVGVIYQMFFSVGILLLPLLAYFITDWRWLQVVITIPYIVFLSYYWWDTAFRFLLFCFLLSLEITPWFLVVHSFIKVLYLCRFIPESPRWLLSQNKKTKAVKITEDMAKENKMTLSKNIEVTAAAVLKICASVADSMQFFYLLIYCNLPFSPLDVVLYLHNNYIYLNILHLSKKNYKIHLI